MEGQTQSTWAALKDSVNKVIKPLVNKIENHPDGGRATLGQPPDMTASASSVPPPLQLHGHQKRYGEEGWKSLGWGGQEGMDIGEAVAVTPYSSSRPETAWGSLYSTNRPGTAAGSMYSASRPRTAAGSMYSAGRPETTSVDLCPSSRPGTAAVDHCPSRIPWMDPGDVHHMSRPGTAALGMYHEGRPGLVAVDMNHISRPETASSGGPSADGILGGNHNVPSNEEEYKHEKHLNIDTPPGKFPRPDPIAGDYNFPSPHNPYYTPRASRANYAPDMPMPPPITEIADLVEQAKLGISQLQYMIYDDDSLSDTLALIRQKIITAAGDPSNKTFIVQSIDLFKSCAERYISYILSFPWSLSVAETSPQFTGLFFIFDSFIVDIQTSDGSWSRELQFPSSPNSLTFSHFSIATLGAFGHIRRLFLTFFNHFCKNNKLDGFMALDIDKALQALLYHELKNIFDESNEGFVNLVGIEERLATIDHEKLLRNERPSRHVGVESFLTAQSDPLLALHRGHPGAVYLTLGYDFQNVNGGSDSEGPMGEYRPASIEFKKKS